MNEKKTREDMGGMELLRRLADDVTPGSSLWRDLRCGREDWWGAMNGGETLADALRGIADRIYRDHLADIEYTYRLRRLIPASQATEAEAREAAERLRVLDVPTLYDIRLGVLGWGEHPKGVSFDDINSAYRDRLVELLDGGADESPMPEGVQWPRYGDGRMVAFGDRVSGPRGPKHVAKVCFFGYGLAALYADGPEVITSLRSGDVATPCPLVAADGEPLIEGEEVYNLSNGWPFVVVACSDDGQVQVRYSGHGCPEWFLASRLTHARPEAHDADGLPVHVGDEVYISEDALPREVKKIDEYGGMYVVPCGWYISSDVRITPPDSQEAIDSDTLKNAGDYCKAHPEAAALREDGLSCKQAQIAHLLRRQRELDAKATGGAQ